MNFWQLSHHAGVIFSGLKLRARTLVNGTSSARKGQELEIRGYAAARLSDEITAVRKVQLSVRRSESFHELLSILQYCIRNSYERSRTNCRSRGFRHFARYTRFPSGRDIKRREVLYMIY